jgi:ergothioneine biosynthesis protein EgtB
VTASTEQQSDAIEVSPLARRVAETRALSLTLAEPLSAEDQVVQPMDDASPTKWHLAHTTWFFETFVAKPHLAGYRPLDERFAYCFNSYYEAAGPRQPRPQRGLLTRPSHAEVLAYRAHVDAALAAMFAGGLPERDRSVGELIELGINHEQQHQELILTDILALFAAEPLRPVYRPSPSPRSSRGEGRGEGQHKAPMPPASAPHPNPLPAEKRGEGTSRPRWIEYPGGIRRVGHEGRSFYFDNERPRHEVLLRDYRLASRLVTNAEWLEFMADGGYEKPGHWLSDGWATVRSRGWMAPGYWEGEPGEWRQMTLAGLLPVDPAAPVAHVSYFEADAFARWVGKRLPTEFEWEAAASDLPVRGNMLGSGALRPLPAPAIGPADKPAQMFGDVWQWTQSAYAAYPGFRAGPGALGEYNGKFMCGQYVLRGASCVTPEGHSRATYRNFFYPHQRWQFTGLRLADDAS